MQLGGGLGRRGLRGLADQAGSLAARFGERLVLLDTRGARRIVGLLGRVEVRLDLVLAAFDRRADLRQDGLGHEEIENGKTDHQPEDLGGESG